MIDINCVWCDKIIKNLAAKEFKRQTKRGRKHFFCDLSCAAHYNNSKRENITKVIIKVCPFCNKEFKTRTGRHEATFCSRSCASAGSVTSHRRQRAMEIGLQNANSDNFTIEGSARGLFNREQWKYQDLIILLDSADERYKFEYPIEPFIFDLALFDRKLLVEFNGPYHEWSKQQKTDLEKMNVAIKGGWFIESVRTEQNIIIKPEMLLPLFKKYQKEISGQTRNNITQG